ncbi:uncharacterized protein BX664DRAFT_323869 [Halteromyces radiatus]|uniref:uncharacterized protein n=1 Tax=Halteromyces radiatus TaxID=101107 RepID=UPI00221F4990|nr:uncharacterized protein BX664DRAFT_323869 [Halteromyces radiatus]KAI8096377.1 hypothetical protein BX664DRAFT_323869 [Halteromyces radiatus]
MTLPLQVTGEIKSSSKDLTYKPPPPTTTSPVPSTVTATAILTPPTPAKASTTKEAFSFPFLVNELLRKQRLILSWSSLRLVIIRGIYPSSSFLTAPGATSLPPLLSTYTAKPTTVDPPAATQLNSVIDKTNLIETPSIPISTMTPVIQTMTSMEPSMSPMDLTLAKEQVGTTVATTSTAEVPILPTKVSTCTPTPTEFKAKDTTTTLLPSPTETDSSSVSSFMSTQDSPTTLQAVTPQPSVESQTPGKDIETSIEDPETMDTPTGIATLDTLPMSVDSSSWNNDQSLDTLSAYTTTTEEAVNSNTTLVESTSTDSTPTSPKSHIRKQHQYVMDMEMDEPADSLPLLEACISSSPTTTDPTSLLPTPTLNNEISSSYNLQPRPSSPVDSTASLPRPNNSLSSSKSTTSSNKLNSYSPLPGGRSSPVHSNKPLPRPSSSIQANNTSPPRIRSSNSPILPKRNSKLPIRTSSSTPSGLLSSKRSSTTSRTSDKRRAIPSLFSSSPTSSSANSIQSENDNNAKDNDFILDNIVSQSSIPRRSATSAQRGTLSSSKPSRQTSSYASTKKTNSKLLTTMDHIMVAPTVGENDQEDEEERPKPISRKEKMARQLKRAEQIKLYRVREAREEREIRLAARKKIIGSSSRMGSQQESGKKQQGNAVDVMAEKSKKNVKFNLNRNRVWKIQDTPSSISTLPSKHHSN